MFASLITGYYSLYSLTKYLWDFRFGLALTEAGVAVITPILPIARLLLAALGIIAAINLILQKKRGLWLSLWWSLLQIPTFTFWFGKPTKEILYGMGAFNLQYFHFGLFSCNCQKDSYSSAFTNISYPLTTCYGVNFIGVIISLMILIPLLQKNERVLNYIKNSSSTIVNRSIVICKSGLFIALLTVILTFIIQNMVMRPNIFINVNQIEFPVDMLFYSKDESLQTIMVNINMAVQNKGKSPTTIKQAYLKLQILPQAWMTDLPIQEYFYPGGSNQGRVKGLSQQKLWAIIPVEFKKEEFRSFRIESEDQATKNISFIIPLEKIIEKGDDPFGVEGFMFKGVVIVETVGGDTFQSKEFQSVGCQFNRRDGRKITIPLGNYSDYLFDIQDVLSSSD